MIKRCLNSQMIACIDKSAIDDMVTVSNLANPCFVVVVPPCIREPPSYLLRQNNAANLYQTFPTDKLPLHAFLCNRLLTNDMTCLKKTGVVVLQ